MRVLYGALLAAGVAMTLPSHWHKRAVVEAIQTRQGRGESLSGTWREDKPLFRVAVTDDLGNPIRGANVQVGHTRNLRDPDGFGRWACSYLDPEGSADIKSVAFEAIEFMPSEFRATRTDEEGRYRFEPS